MEISPIKPPRALKHAKEPSEILMSVIRALSASDSNEQREDERVKLEKEFKKSDRKLEDLIAKHEVDLVKVMEMFDSVTNNVNQINSYLKNVEHNLDDSKSLFEDDLDDIERLYYESIEYKYTIEILEEIEMINKIPQQLSELFIKRRYLKATKLLINTIFDRQSEFDDVFGLRELNEELSVKKSNLQKQLFKELIHFLYERSISDMEYAISSKTELFNLLNKQITKEEFIEVMENKTVSENENSIYFMAIIVKSITLLNQTTGIVEYLKSNMQSELFQVINNSIKSVLESSKMTFEAEREHLKSTHSNELFVKAVNLIFDHLKIVAYHHQVLEKFFEYATLKSAPIYDLTHFWHSVQIVLIELLKDCLDMDNVKEVAQDEAIVDADDVSKYFIRKLPVTKKKLCLFRFDVSTNPIMNSYRTTISLVLNNKDKFGNLLIIFQPLTQFLDDVVKLFKINLTKVNEFLHLYVTGNYLKRLFFKFHKEIDEVTRSKNAWRNVTLLNETKNSKPLLQSTLVIEKSLKESEKLISILKTFKNHIISLVINLVQEYYDVCYTKYMQVVQQQNYNSNSEVTKSVYSASWITDNDINRYLKSLNNWKLLKNLTDDSIEAINGHNVHEAELLTGNLGEIEIQMHEIISDISSLKELAYIHESMEWLVLNLKTFSSRLDPQKIFENINFKLEQFSDLCLLVLHLEIRVQCFHYLSTKNVLICKDSLEPDQKIIEFNRFLIRLDEAMTFCLNSLKFNYIFDGLGDLMSKILINTARFIPYVDEIVIQQMQRNIFTLQRALTNITYSRELALDYANDFYELLYLTEEEILNELAISGRQFSDLEYTIAFKLLSKSKKESSDKLAYKLKKLGQVLQNVKQ